MTRKEQIKEYLLTIGNGDMNVTPFDVGFECGVEWADAHPNWISVEDEMPKDGTLVIAITPNLKVAIAQYENDEWNISDLCCLKKVTHWMPLPSPPKKGDQGND